MKHFVSDDLADVPTSVSAQLTVARESVADLEAKVKQLDADLAGLEREIEAGGEVTAALAHQRKEWADLRRKAAKKIEAFAGFVSRLEAMKS